MIRDSNRHLALAGLPSCQDNARCAHALHLPGEDRGTGTLRLARPLEWRNAHAAADPPRPWIVLPLWEVVVARAQARPAAGHDPQRAIVADDVGHAS